jgi:hypothetical protein
MGDMMGAAIPASGRAILASQQGGMLQIGDLLDNLRHLDKRVFRCVWARVRQFWTAEKWVRVTDDERNMKWLGLNLAPYAMAQLQMHAQAFQQEAQAALAGATGPLAELDCDIIIDEAPDSLTPQIEQFQALVDLKKYDRAGEIPFRAIVRAMPNLKDKQIFLKDMEEQAAQSTQSAQGPPPSQQSQQLQQLQLRGAAAEVAETESKAALNFAKAREIERARAERLESSSRAFERSARSALPLAPEHTTKTGSDASSCGGSGECTCSHCVSSHAH